MNMELYEFLSPRPGTNSNPSGTDLDLMSPHFLHPGHASFPLPSRFKGRIIYKNDHSTSHVTGLLQDIGPCILILGNFILAIILSGINVASFACLWPTLRKEGIGAIIL